MLELLSRYNLKVIGVPYAYIVYLYVLSGVPLEKADFDRISEDDPIKAVEYRRIIVTMMVEVCHPSIDDQILSEYYHLQSFMISEIHYDPTISSCDKESRCSSLWKLFNDNGQIRDSTPLHEKSRHQLSSRWHAKCCARSSAQ